MLCAGEVGDGGSGPLGASQPHPHRHMAPVKRGSGPGRMAPGEKTQVWRSLPEEGLMVFQMHLKVRWWKSAQERVGSGQEVLLGGCGEEREDQYNAILLNHPCPTTPH